MFSSTSASADDASFESHLANALKQPNLFTKKHFTHLTKNKINTLNAYLFCIRSLNLLRIENSVWVMRLNNKLSQSTLPNVILSQLLGLIIFNDILLPHATCNDYRYILAQFSALAETVVVGKILGLAPRLNSDDINSLLASRRRANEICKLLLAYRTELDKLLPIGDLCETDIMRASYYAYGKISFDAFPCLPSDASEVLIKAQFNIPFDFKTQEDSFLIYYGFKNVQLVLQSAQVSACHHSLIGYPFEKETAHYPTVSTNMNEIAKQLFTRKESILIGQNKPMPTVKDSSDLEQQLRASMQQMASALFSDPKGLSSHAKVLSGLKKQFDNVVRNTGRVPSEEEVQKMVFDTVFQRSTCPSSATSSTETSEAVNTRRDSSIHVNLRPN